MLPRRLWSRRQRPARPAKRQRSQSPSDDLSEARKKVWLDDLKSIRRKRPLCKGKPTYTVNFNRILSQQKGGKVQKSGKAPAVVSLSSDSDGKTSPSKKSGHGQGVSNPQPISLDSDSDDQKPQATSTSGSGDEKVKGYKLKDVQEYYGLKGTTPKVTTNRVRYQTGFNRDGKYPSPSSGLDFDVTQLWEDLGWPKVTKKSVKEDYESLGFVKVCPQPLELAITKYWLSSGPADLATGFPMVEDVVFAVQPNTVGEASNCFFKAVAYHVYGDHRYHRRVKAEHLHLLHTVLGQPDHPRHDLYHRMNNRFYSSVVGSGSKYRTTVANLYQMLTIPKLYTALDMFDITADLYNLFIVVYTLGDNREVTGVTTMGSYNARHVFINHVDGNHFQPMVPNEYYASEFQLPRITYDSTLGYPTTSKKDEGKHALEHTWRNRWRGALDRREGALPVDHIFFRERLENVSQGTQAKS